MITRRLLMQATASAAMLTTFDAGPAAALGSPGMLLFEEGEGDALPFVALAKAGGASVLPLAGDPGEIWFGQVQAALRNGAAALSGVTGPRALFCLETLARTEGMRLTFACRGSLDDASVLPALLGRGPGTVPPDFLGSLVTDERGLVAWRLTRKQQA